MTRRLIKRLHHDDRAQIAPLMIFAALPFAMLVAFIFNSGEQSISRMLAQDAADAAAMSQASWVARTMNVMAMNNVGITQAHAINVMITTLQPEVAAGLVEAARKHIEYVQMALQCPSKASACVIGYAVCLAACIAYYAALTAHLAIWVDKPLIDIQSEMGLGIPPPLAVNFKNIALSLAAMNGHLATNSRDFIRKMQGELAELNGLAKIDDSLILYAAYSADDPYAMPVEETDLGLELCKTGRLGEFLGPVPGGSNPLNVVLDHNFGEHGYKYGTGPYPVGRKTIKDAIAKPIDALEGIFHKKVPLFVPTDGKLKIPDALRFDKAIDPAYAAACLSKTMFFSGPMTLYKVANPRTLLDFGDQDSRDEWSVTAIVRKPRPRAAIFGDPVAKFGFDNPPNRVYGIAQAEIYNGRWYDLYTQSWRAKLVPAHIMENTAKRDELIAAAQSFTSLHDYLTKTKNQLGEIYAH